MTERLKLAHLAGYASIAAVLATAEWAGPLAMVLVVPLLAWTLYHAGDLVVRRLTARARADLEEQATGGAAATDGGLDRGRDTADDRHCDPSPGMAGRYRRALSTLA